MSKQIDVVNVVLIISRRELMTLLDLAQTARFDRGDQRASVLSAEDKLSAAVRSQILGERFRY